MTMNYPFETGKMYRIEGIDAIMDAYGKGYRLWVVYEQALTVHMVEIKNVIKIAPLMLNHDPNFFGPNPTEENFVEQYLKDYKGVIFSESQYNPLAGGITEDPYEAIKIGPPPAEHCVLCGRSLDLCRCCSDFEDKI